jgi:hypothetical protein
MSADNDLYILETEGDNGDKEYRVADLQAIENYLYDDNYNESEDPDVHIKNARKMWKGASVYRNEGMALLEAKSLLNDSYMCEYGICFGICIISIPRKF